MQIASTRACAIIVRTLVNAATLYVFANAAAFSGERAHTATNSDSGNVRNAAAWRWPTFPQPTRAVRSLGINDVSMHRSWGTSNIEHRTLNIGCGSAHEVRQNFGVRGSRFEVRTPKRA